MGYFTAHELYNKIKDEPGATTLYNFAESVRFRTTLSENCRNWAMQQINGHPVTLEQVEALCNTFHNELIEGNFAQWKSLRPWVLFDLTANLSPDKAWIGWEVETGWADEEDRSKAIADLFATYEHVCLDDEGAEYAVEMTWPPRDQGHYQNEDNHPLVFVTKLAREHDAYWHGPVEQIGTHVNISTPAFRALSAEEQEQVTSCMTVSVAHLDYDNKAALFGRGELYGGFFYQNHAGPTKAWMEGKLFNSTYDRKEAKRYIKVGDRLAFMIEELSKEVADRREKLGHYALLHVTNTAKVLRGETDELNYRCIGVSCVRPELVDPFYVTYGADEHDYEEDDDL